MSSLNPRSDLRRHALVWLRQAPQPDLKQDVAEVVRWHERGNPWIACRHRSNPDHISLGFCVASTDVKTRRPRRISVEAHQDIVLRVDRPPSLAVIAKNCSASTLAGPLSELAANAASEGLNIHVFGSWMWQSLTGDIYVTSSSDLDVLVDVVSEAEANRAASFIQDQEAKCPIKIDGELSFLNRGEVHWREYLSEAPEVLLKSINTVRLMPREDLWK